MCIFCVIWCIPNTSSQSHTLNLCSQIVRFIPIYLGLEDEHGKESPGHFSHKTCEQENRYLWGSSNNPCCLPLFRTLRKKKKARTGKRLSSVWIQLVEIKTHVSHRQSLLEQVQKSQQHPLCHRSSDHHYSFQLPGEVGEMGVAHFVLKEWCLQVFPLHWACLLIKGFWEKYRMQIIPTVSYLLTMKYRA